jgi:hypothetical protein
MMGLNERFAAETAQPKLAQDWIICPSRCVRDFCALVSSTGQRHRTTGFLDGLEISSPSAFEAFLPVTHYRVESLLSYRKQTTPTFAARHYHNHALPQHRAPRESQTADLCLSQPGTPVRAAIAVSHSKKTTDLRAARYTSTGRLASFRLTRNTNLPALSTRVQHSLFDN